MNIEDDFRLLFGVSCKQYASLNKPRRLIDKASGKEINPGDVIQTKYFIYRIIAFNPTRNRVLINEMKTETIDIDEPHAKYEILVDSIGAIYV